VPDKTPTVSYDLPSFDGEFWGGFREWVFVKYAKSYAPNVVCYVKKYHSLLGGSLGELDTFSKSKRNGVVRALVILSKYLGCYEAFKAKLRNYGFK